MKKFIFVMGSFFVMLWLISFFKFAFSIEQDIKDTKSETDAIVVLTGGANRVEESLKLLKNGLAKTLFISGVYKETSFDEIIPDNVPKKNIILGKAAQNTLENAKEIANFVHRNNIKSVRLVTSSYHMKRSVLEMEIFVPNVKIIPHPVFSDSFKHKDWWKWPGTIWLTIKEHAKYNFVLLRNFLFTFFDINYEKITSFEDSHI